jgi:hypothetical protein
MRCGQRFTFVKGNKKIYDYVRKNVLEIKSRIWNGIITALNVVHKDV